MTDGFFATKKSRLAPALCEIEELQSIRAAADVFR